MRRRGFLTTLAAVAVAPFVPRRKYEWRTYSVPMSEIRFKGAPIVEDLYEPVSRDYGMGENVFFRVYKTKVGRS